MDPPRRCGPPTVIDAAPQVHAIFIHVLIVMAWIFGIPLLILGLLGARKRHGTLWERQEVTIRCLVLLALMLTMLVVAYAGPLAFFILVLALVLIALGELWTVLAAAGHVPLRVSGWAAGAMLVTAAYAGGVTAIGPALAIGALGLLYTAVFTSGRQRATHRFAATLVGLTYVSLCGAFLLLLRTERGFGALVFPVAVIQLADVSAFFGGRAFGRHRLAPSLSPGKTIEGTAVGLAGGLIGALLFRFAIAGMSITAALVIGVVLTAVAIAGDLVASGFKREAGVKDFSRLLPGHGGILDRFDGTLAAAPVAWLLLQPAVLRYL